MRTKDCGNCSTERKRAARPRIFIQREGKNLRDPNMTIPASTTTNADSGADNGKQNESTPLMPSIRESGSTVSNRSVQFDHESSRKIDSQSSRSHHYLHKASSYLGKYEDIRMSLRYLSK